MNGSLRRLAVALLLAALAAVWASIGLAEASLGAYKLERQSDGGLCHRFDEVTVTVPADWMGRYTVLEYGDRAAFCLESAHRLVQEREGREDGGLLFEVCVSETGDFGDGFSTIALGGSDRGAYCLRFPPEEGDYAGDAATVEAYRELRGDLDYVRENSYVHVFHTLPAPPEANEAEPQAAFLEQDALYAGGWVTFEDGFKLYLPSHWQSGALSDAQRAAGLFYLAGDDGQGDVAGGVGVGYMAAGDLRGLDELAEDFRRSGYADVEEARLHGLSGIRFARPEDDYRGAAFYHPSRGDYILYVYVSPLGADGSPEALAGEAILDSLSPWPD